MLSEQHYDLIDVLSQLERLGVPVPTFSVPSLSDASAAIWLKSERARLDKLAKATGELYA